MSQVKTNKAAVFQKDPPQAQEYILTNWQDMELMLPQGSLSVNSAIVRDLTNKMAAITSDELISAVSDDFDRSLLKNFDSGLVVPLNATWGMNGILFVGQKIDQSAFTKEDKEFLSLLSGQMAVALENARLYEAERKALADLQATHEQRIHTERLAALGEMSAQIAHEINNPLGIIKNYLMLIRKSQDDSTQSAKYVEIVGQEIDRITAIVRELLQNHRSRQTDYHVIDVLNVIEEVVSFMSPQFSQSNIKCTCLFAADSLKVKASRENLKQVFMNVLLNAIDAMPRGGDIKIMTCRQGGEFLIQFQDSGPGVPEKHLPHIFEAFFTTKAEGKGTGLGLAVCFGMIKKHRGTITFKNTDKGGCVEIILQAAGIDHD